MRLRFWLSLAALLICISYTTNSAHAEISRAQVMNIVGEAKFMKSGQSEWMKLNNGAILREGDVIKTAKGSQVNLTLMGARKTAELVVREQSEFKFEAFNFDAENKVDITLLDVSLGAVLVKAEKLVGESKFEVKTPTSIVGIRGTTFEVNVAKTSDQTV
jgi:hypothetical protein